MTIITFREILDLIVMTLALGYIFSGFLKQRTIESYLNPASIWGDIKLSMLITAPGVVLHELGHKFVALLLGLKAEFFASYFGLGLGVVLKLIQSPLLVFVPGFVQVSASTPLQGAITAFAGPLVNLILWIVGFYILKYKKRMSTKEMMGWFLMKKINMILFLFNMIPLPPFDGFQVFLGLFRTLF
ncbi:M50 family metallopeptidase [Candidatus Woesearchaeota archaeon]|nr:M50 family metallopeptidase [Candidatus Woesearchaeota archaeon]